MNCTSGLAVIDRNVDVGIITIVPVEVESLFSALDIKRDAYETADGPLRYWRTSYNSNSSGRPLSVVVSILGGEAGNTEAAIATAQFLRDWYPKIMCLVGIAAGIEDKARIADVIVPNKIHDRTIKVYENGQYRVRGRTYARNDTIDRMLKVSPLTQRHFIAALRKFAQEDLLRAKIVAKEKGLLPSQFSGEPRMVDGSLASDNILIKDSTYFESILDGTDEKCRGGEMEAAGFVLACQREYTDFPWLVFRGISDFGDCTKDDSFQLLAAKAACTLLKLFIERILVIDALPLNPRALRSTRTLEFNLVRQIRNAYAAKRWKEVCRLGAVISRSLWLSGHAPLRYELGLYVENAAAYSGNRPLRAITLIDDLGYTALSLGQVMLGKKHIDDGIRLATECGDYYVIAKGYRHLASLHRQEGDLDSADHHLQNAREAANRITDSEQHQEIVATLQTSTAKLFMERGQWSEAISLLFDALKMFQSSGDVEREIKVYAQLARCSEHLGDLLEAERLYVIGRTMAREAGRFDEYRRNTESIITLIGENDQSRCRMLAGEVVNFAKSQGLLDEANNWREMYHLSDEFTESN